MGMIIAMKGHPGTGKSTLAQSLASALKFPLLDKDDVRDCTLPVQHALALTSPDASASSLLNDLSYRAIWQIASTQLRLGLGGVVLDSPLSRRVHLDRLLDLAASHGARLLIVECKPSDQAEWRRRLERRAQPGPEVAGERGGWHKPATWRDIERLMDGYAGCTDYDVGGVPRMVVDTTAFAGVGELITSVLEFICSHGGPSFAQLNCPTDSSKNYED